MKYRWKTRPYLHQIQAVKKLLSTGFGGALLMEPRTGKTKVTIDYLSILAQHGKIDRVLIVCPARVADVWVEQFGTHCPLNTSVTVWDARARRTTPLPRPNPAHDLTVVVVNYEAFSTPGRKLRSGRRSKANGRFKHRGLLLRWVAGANAACVLDESHKIKSPSGRAANMVVTMGKAFPYRVILTGTPVTKAKRVHDVYMQWKFLNPQRLTNMQLFTAADVQDYTGVWTNRNGYPQWLRARDEHLEDLREQIHQDAFAVTRDECYDLPDQLEPDIRWINLTGETARVYDMMAQEMVAEIIDMNHRDGHHTIEASIKLVQALRLAQITGGVAKTDEGRLLRIGQHKLIELKEIFEEEAIEKEEKLIVAARFKSDLNAIARLATSMKLPVYQLRGGISREEGTRNIRNFQRRDEPSIFVAQPSAGSLGIDLSSCGRIIWYSMTTSFVDFSQFNDRIALHQKARQYTYLLARNTIDNLLYQAMQDDGDVARLMVTRPQLLLRRS